MGEQNGVQEPKGEHNGAQEGKAVTVTVVHVGQGRASRFVTFDVGGLVRFECEVPQRSGVKFPCDSQGRDVPKLSPRLFDLVDDFCRDVRKAADIESLDLPSARWDL